MGLTCGRFRGYPVRVGKKASRNAQRRTAGETRSPIPRSAQGVKVVEVSLMTIRHQTWLTDALAGSAMLFALYLILLEFSKARLP